MQTTNERKPIHISKVWFVLERASFTQSKDEMTSVRGWYHNGTGFTLHTSSEGDVVVGWRWSSKATDKRTKKDAAVKVQEMNQALSDAGIETEVVEPDNQYTNPYIICTSFTPPMKQATLRSEPAGTLFQLTKGDHKRKVVTLVAWQEQQLADVTLPNGRTIRVRNSSLGPVVKEEEVAVEA